MEEDVFLLSISGGSEEVLSCHQAFELGDGAGKATLRKKRRQEMQVHRLPFV